MPRGQAVTSSHGVAGIAPPPGLSGRGGAELEGAGMGTGFTPGGSNTLSNTTTEANRAGMEAFALAGGSRLDPTLATNRSVPFAENCIGGQVCVFLFIPICSACALYKIQRGGTA